MQKITGPMAAELVKRMLEDGEVDSLEEAVCAVFEVADAINRAIESGIPEKRIKDILRNSVLPMS